VRCAIYVPAIQIRDPSWGPETRTARRQVERDTDGSAMRSDDSAPRDAGARLVCLFFGGPGGVDRAAPGGGISSLDPGREGHVSARCCWPAALQVQVVVSDAADHLTPDVIVLLDSSPAARRRTTRFGWRRDLAEYCSASEVNRRRLEERFG
jgi:hypothetical protein